MVLGKGRDLRCEGLQPSAVSQALLDPGLVDGHPYYFGDWWTEFESYVKGHDKYDPKFRRRSSDCRGE